MRADNSRYIIAAAHHRHELTRAKAIAALHELDRDGSPITFESVATAAGVSRSWLYAQTDLKDEIRRLRARNQPQHTNTPPRRQQASDASLLRRLEAAHQRNRELTAENNTLRRQLAQALGQLRTGPHRTDTSPSKQKRSSSITNGPC